MPSSSNQFPADVRALAAQAKVLAHPARLHILRLLAERGECICGDVVEELPLAQATVSRHLKSLVEAGLVRVTADGPRSCYCLNRPAIDEQRGAFLSFWTTLDAPAPADCC
ncbi:ArsR/SmtB family transcription factor [Salisaeta longa]|uniref:ArsR/SmtB family transcription factor n=1 Tax=Salisaeta longa TaxID=503170 RepID=UPI0003B69023|nr:metalloregulator ArsR/SmtB family transcription factor [Salisaeta longa]